MSDCSDKITLPSVALETSPAGESSQHATEGFNSKDPQFLAKKKWREKNRLRHNLAGRNWYLKNKARAISASYKRVLAWRAKNPDKLKLQQKKWADKNRPHKRATSKLWRKNNLVRHDESCKAWRIAHPNHNRIYKINWKIQNPEKVKLSNHRSKTRRRSLTIGKLSCDLAYRLLILQSGKCAAACGSMLSETGYHLDHIIALINGGKNVDSNIQLLCPKCNLTKSNKDPIRFMQEKGFLL